MVVELPREALEYIERSTRDGGARAELLALLRRIYSGERVSPSEVRSKYIGVHVRRLKKAGVLVVVEVSGKRYLSFNPELLGNGKDTGGR